MSSTITKTILLAGVILFLFSGCRPSYYIVKDFPERTKTHKTVAIIPVEMVFTGVKPKKLTEYQIDSIEDAESLAFQLSLFNNLLRYSTSKKGNVTVEFQNYEKTNKLLAEKGIKLRDAWTADPATLCTALGVDAIVKTRIVKQRYMSEAASFGVQMVNRALGPVGGLGWPINEVTKGGRTNDIDAQCSLLNNTDGIVLWKDMHKGAADWNNPPAQIIERITVRFAKNFPYRKKDK